MTSSRPLGHEDVHQYEIGALLPLQPQPRISVPRFKHLVARRLQCDPDRAPEQRVIIHHENSCHAAATRPAMNPGPAALSARVSPG